VVRGNPQLFQTTLSTGYNLFMGVNEMHVKILRLPCQLGLVLRLESV